MWHYRLLVVERSGAWGLVYVVSFDGSFEMEKSDRVDSFLLGSLLRMCHIALWRIRKKLKGKEGSEPAESRNNREIQRR